MIKINCNYSNSAWESKVVNFILSHHRLPCALAIIACCGVFAYAYFSLEGLSNKEESSPSPFVRRAKERQAKKEGEEEQLKAQEAAIRTTLASLTEQVAKQNGPSPRHLACLFVPNRSFFTLLNKINNFFNPFVHLFSFINSHSILQMPSKPWPPEDAQRRHDTFNLIGAEQLLLESDQGDLIDAMYIDVQHFLRDLERLGGKRILISFDLEQNNLHHAVPVQVNSDLGACQGLMIPYQPPLFDEGKDKELIDFYKIRGLVALELDEWAGLLFIKAENRAHINPRHHPYFESNLSQEEQKIILAAFDLEGESNEKKIGGFYFKDKGIYIDAIHEETTGGKKRERKFKGTKHLPAIQYIYEKFEMGKTQWTLKSVDKDLYLIKRSDIGFFNHWLQQAQTNPSTASIEVFPSQSAQSSVRGCVLLSMNQTAAYQQNPAEMLALLLEGIHVAAYNYCGKGLSKGKNATANIHAAIEIVHRYIRQIKGIPDHLILAKGQCFGAAPTCAFLEKHPEVNGWVDQAPNNFIDIVPEILAKRLPVLIRKKAAEGETLKNRALFIIYSTMQNIPEVYTITSVVLGAILPDCDNAQALRKSRGHKLMTINVKSPQGFGGDELVPLTHDEQFKQALFPSSPGKESALVPIVGGTHVTTWSRDKTCYNEVAAFLKKTGLAVDLFTENDLEQEIPDFSVRPRYVPKDPTATDFKIFDESI